MPPSGSWRGEINVSFSEAQKTEINTAIDNKLNLYRREVEGRVNATQKDMQQLRIEVHGLRQDFSKSSDQISAQLKVIASSMEKLAGLPEAWQNFTGFLGFVKWTRDNMFAVAIIITLVLGSTYLLLKEILGG